MLWRLIKTLLAICGIILGGWMCAVGYSVKIGPFINAFLFLGGTVLSGSCFTYLLARLIKRNIVE
ncbi:hypothetical protein FHS10_002357 [Mucilaginibacter dorajii]|nr:hypothetical protein [Mucilaginibacter dorajii]